MQRPDDGETGSKVIETFSVSKAGHVVVGTQHAVAGPQLFCLDPALQTWLIVVDDQDCAHSDFKSSLPLSVNRTVRVFLCGGRLVSISHAGLADQRASGVASH